MQTLAAGRFQEGLQAELVHARPDLLDRLDDVSPGDARIGVEVEDDLVRQVRPIGLAAPWMQLDDAPLDEGDQAMGVLDHQIVFIAPLHRNAGVEQIGRLLAGDMALEKTLAAYAFRTTHHR